MGIVIFLLNLILRKLGSEFLMPAIIGQIRLTGAWFIALRQFPSINYSNSFWITDNTTKWAKGYVYIPKVEQQRKLHPDSAVWCYMSRQIFLIKGHLESFDEICWNFRSSFILTLVTIDQAKSVSHTTNGHLRVSLNQSFTLLYIHDQIQC